MRRIVLLNLILLIFCAAIKAQSPSVSCPTSSINVSIDKSLHKWEKSPFESDGTLCPGTVTTFTANVSNLNSAAKPTFKWKVSIGEILSGQGTSSIEVRTPVNGGELEVTVELAGLPSFLSHCSVQFSKTVSIALCCLPCLNFAIADFKFEPNDESIFTAKVILSSNDDEEMLEYEWMISSGVILEGQGTKTIKVKRPETGEACTVTVKVKGMPPECPYTASRTTDIICKTHPRDVTPSQEQNIESFDGLKLAEMKEQLDALGYEMTKNPNTQCHITAHGLPSDKREDIDRKLEAIINYLADNHNVASNRIVIVYGDYRAKFEVEFQIVPLQ